MQSFHNNYECCYVKHFFFQEPPFVFKSKHEPEKKEGLSFEVYKNVTTGYYYYGYCIDLIYKIADDLQFDFTLYEPEDGSYGTMQEDGSWNGIVKDLMDEVKKHLEL